MWTEQQNALEGRKLDSKAVSKELCVSHNLFLYNKFYFMKKMHK